MGDNIGEMQKSTHNKSDDTLIADMLEKRCDELNSHFKWSQENIQKIMDVNSLVWEKTAELKNYLNTLSKAFQELAKKDSFF